MAKIIGAGILVAGISEVIENIILITLLIAPVSDP
jgi:hypothetical protein